MNEILDNAPIFIFLVAIGMLKAEPPIPSRRR